MTDKALFGLSDRMKERLAGEMLERQRRKLEGGAALKAVVEPRKRHPVDDIPDEFCRGLDG